MEKAQCQIIRGFLEGAGAYEQLVLEPAETQAGRHQRARFLVSQAFAFSRRHTRASTEAKNAHRLWSNNDDNAAALAAGQVFEILGKQDDAVREAEALCDLVFHSTKPESVPFGV